MERIFTQQIELMTLQRQNVNDILGRQLELLSGGGAKMSGTEGDVRNFDVLPGGYKRGEKEKVRPDGQSTANLSNFVSSPDSSVAPESTEVFQADPAVRVAPTGGGGQEPKPFIPYQPMVIGEDGDFTEADRKNI